MGILKMCYKSIICAIILMFCSMSAQAGYEQASLRYDIESPRKMGLQYDVYAGGFRALDAELILDLDRSAYDMELKAQTHGFIGKLFPWSADFTTSGQAKDGIVVPSQHVASSTWRDNTSTTEMSYDPQGRLYKTMTEEKGKTTVKRDIDRDMATGAVDMLSAALLILQNARHAESCAGTFPVFDGKRRFDITLQDKGTETLPKSDYSKFSGEAMKCSVLVKPVAGFTDKDQKRGWLAVQNHTKERKMLPLIWLARIDGDGPVVPVRMQIRSQYGAVVAHLSGSAAK